MSIKKKKAELRRLIDAFSKEADKFHDISLSQYFFTEEPPIQNRVFREPNHAIMLWQYVGKIGGEENSVEKLVENIQGSDLNWGLRGTKLTAMAVVEGEKVNLFVRMATRAGRLFNEDEAHFIRLRVLNEVFSTEQSSMTKPVGAVNGYPLAIWINYLLYYISKIHSGSEKVEKIEPDPFSLSLLALEDLLDTENISKVDKSLSRVSDIEFKVALSFSGEQRSYVSKVVDELKKELEEDQVFYDFDYQSQLALPNLDTLLQNIYRHNSKLVVVFLSKEYAKKEWCGLEWRAIKDIIKAKSDEQIMFVRFDSTKIDGVFSTDGYIDADYFSEGQVAKLILERLAILT